MAKVYVIQWKSKSNGRSGRGTKLLELEEAQDLVRELNADYPDIEHEAVMTQPQPGAAAPPASPESAPPAPPEPAEANPGVPLIADSAPQTLSLLE